MSWLVNNLSFWTDSDRGRESEKEKMNCEQIFRKVNSEFQKSFNKFFSWKIHLNLSTFRSSLKTNIPIILKNVHINEFIFTFNCEMLLIIRRRRSNIVISTAQRKINNSFLKAIHRSVLTLFIESVSCTFRLFFCGTKRTTFDIYLEYRVWRFLHRLKKITTNSVWSIDEIIVQICGISNCFEKLSIKINSVVTWNVGCQLLSKPVKCGGVHAQNAIFKIYLKMCKEFLIEADF